MTDTATESTVTTTAEPDPAPDPDTLPPDEGQGDESDSESDTFPRSYVEKLRRESAGYRERAARADELAGRLHTELVRAGGKLADPSDLAFDAAHLDDIDALNTAVDALVAAKPHLASRRPVGDIGQGASTGAATVDLAAMLRQRAM